MASEYLRKSINLEKIRVTESVSGEHAKQYVFVTDTKSWMSMENSQPQERETGPNETPSEIWVERYHKNCKMLDLELNTK